MAQARVYLFLEESGAGVGVGRVSGTQVPRPQPPPCVSWGSGPCGHGHLPPGVVGARAGVREVS